MQTLPVRNMLFRAALLNVIGADVSSISAQPTTTGRPSFEVASIKPKTPWEF